MGRASTDIVTSPPLAGESSRSVSRAARLRGEPRLPGDKSISHRALILAALAEGCGSIIGAGDGRDVRATAAIVAALGATVERAREDGLNVDYRVASPGAERLHEPAGVLDCRNSGTSLRLCSGMLASLPFFAVLDGDDSLRSRPVARIIEPLRSMGAALYARSSDTLPPLVVIGRHRLNAIDYATRVPSAQVKSAILLAGLRAEGRTTVREAVATRDHTERMLRSRGIEVRREPGTSSGGGPVAWTLDGGTRLRPVDELVPADPSAAAFWLVAGAIHPDAELTLRAVGVNPTRRAAIDLLVRMGARIDETPVDGASAAGPGAAGDVGEPLADLTVRSSELRGIDVGPDEVAAAIDEIPILCLAATQARGKTTIRGAGELRNKESDRIAGIVKGLAALGARIAVDGDDISMQGSTPLVGAATETLDDHRLAMTFAVAGLIASGSTSIDRAGSAAVSYPTFFTELERLRA
ncbi:MAG TPA: 3-phosphoshikimate 1-carboxyvinyltransferase [Candidatus Limnocylindrales bacterium]|jgi:3-phosphoshikimate 1-carboxyvinyltransferase